jgi:hypothetical protein
LSRFLLRLLLESEGVPLPHWRLDR